jgi:hypothetical protein
MADYYPLIARAVAGLDKSTGENRRALYERARSALVAQLRGVTPALSESDVTRERLALEEAIRKVEAEAAKKTKLEIAAPPIPPKPQPVAWDDAPQASASPSPRSAPQMPRGSPMQMPRGGAPAAVPAVAREQNYELDDFDQKPPAPQRSPLRPPPPDSARRPLSDSGLKDFRGVVAEANELGHASAQANRSAREAYDSVPERDADMRSNARLFDREPHPQRMDFDAPSMLEPAINLDEARPSSPRTRSMPEEAEPELRPPPSYRKLFKTAALLLVIAAIGGLIAWQWPNVMGVYEWATAPGQPQPQVASQTQQTPAQAPKNQERVEPSGPTPVRPGTMQPSPTPSPAAAVAQKVVLYEEDPQDPQGKRTVGSAIWRSETVSPGPGMAPELAIRADIEIPERKIAMIWSLRRNTDKALPASHTIEIMFKLPPDFAPGGIANVPGILMKAAEQTRGVPLAGLAVKVTNGYFLIGLSAVDADRDRNLQLLKDRTWFDVPMVYANNRRAILAIEKGTPGERVFADAFKAWGQ